MVKQFPGNDPEKAPNTHGKFKPISPPTSFDNTKQWVVGFSLWNDIYVICKLGLNCRTSQIMLKLSLNQIVVLIDTNTRTYLWPFIYAVFYSLSFYNYRLLCISVLTETLLQFFQWFLYMFSNFFLYFSKHSRKCDFSLIVTLFFISFIYQWGYS